MADADTTRPRAQSDTIHIRCRGAKSFVDDLGQSRGVVLSRAVHFCDLLRLSRTTRRFVRFRRTRLRRRGRARVNPSSVYRRARRFFKLRAIAGHPIAGVRTLPIFPFKRLSVARCGSFAVTFSEFSRLKVPHRAIFFNLISIAGHPIAGVRTLPIFRFHACRFSLPGALPLGREFLRTFAAEGSAPGYFFQLYKIGRASCRERVSEIV